jgi:predicted small lipoprotein YifL
MCLDGLGVGGRFALAAIALISVAGCGGGPAVVPPAEAARKSIEAGLQAWATGSKPGQISGAPVTTHFVDSVWGSGRKLVAFSVTEAESTGSDRRFLARLTLARPDAVDEVHYVVIGADPIWVYRADDYERMLNMDNNPAPVTKGRRRP